MPEILEEQQSYVREKKIDFIVTKNKKLEEDFSDAILKDYRLICEDSFLLHNTDIRYYLYQKI